MAINFNTSDLKDYDLSDTEEITIQVAVKLHVPKGTYKGLEENQSEEDYRKQFCDYAQRMLNSHCDFGVAEVDPEWSDIVGYPTEEAKDKDGDYSWSGGPVNTQILG